MKNKVKISLFKIETSLPGNEDRTNEPEIGGCSRGNCGTDRRHISNPRCPHAQWRTVKYSRPFLASSSRMRGHIRALLLQCVFFFEIRSLSFIQQWHNTKKLRLETFYVAVRIFYWNVEFWKLDPNKDSTIDTNWNNNNNNNNLCFKNLLRNELK